MRLGPLRHRVTVALRQDVPDSFTSLESIFVDPAPRWADIQPVKGGTWIGSRQIGAEVTHTIRVRYIDGVTSDHEVSEGSRRFRVRRAYNLQERGAWLMMDCEELQR